MYIVYYISHTDCYKRADSTGGVVKSFENKDKAYELAVKENCREINNGYGMSKTHWKYMRDSKFNYCEKYSYLLDNFENIYGEPEFTMAPSHTFFYVKFLKGFADNNFEKDINKYTELNIDLNELNIKDDEDTDTD